LVSIQNSAVLTANLPGGVTCPSWDTANRCRSVSFPLLANDVIWKNRSFHIGVGALGGGTLNQQAVVTLLNAFTNSNVASQSTTDAVTANGTGQIITGGTGACVSGVSYWDLGVRGDTGPTNHSSGVTLAPTYSFLTPGSTGYTGTGNSTVDPTVFSQYCNGSRTPPEFKSLGYQVPPGISDATVPNPVFNLTPAATVDEGNNWINLSWGPLALNNATNGSGLGNYALAGGSPAIDYIPSTATANYNEAPPKDFFDNPRKTAGNPCVDVGAVDVAAVTTCKAGTGGGGGGPTKPALTVLDNFNRAAALNLNTGAPAGVAWNETTVAGFATIGILDQTGGNPSTGVAFTLTGGNAFWAGTGNPFGARQAAAFTFVGTPTNNTGLALKATGGTATAPTSYVRVRYTTAAGGTITIATTTNGTAFTTAPGGTLTGFGNLANGDTLTAMVDATGVVNVWKTSGGNTTFIGTANLPSVPAWTTGGGRIGMLLPVATALDNFAGGNVP
jgi:hypothetical protein